MSKFFVPYLKRSDFTGKRYKVIRDLPVFLIICFLDLRNTYLEHDFEKLIQGYFVWVEKRIEEEKMRFKKYTEH